MRVAVYTRVSRDDVRERRSVGEQEVACREIADREGWQVVEAFVDNDVSASRYARKSRPDFAKLLIVLDRGDCDVLILWEASRGSRKLTEWAAMLDTCHDRGIFIHVVDQGRTLDPRRPRDMRTLQEDGVDSEYESAKTRSRVLRGVRAKAIEGRPHGKLAYGYARRYDERGVFVEQYELVEQGAVLREMARRALAGESCYAIAKSLNELGVPTASCDARWTGERVRRLLVSPAYAGRRVHQGQVVGDAVWPPIIEPGDHERLRARLLDPSRRTVRDPSVRHLLTGAARCGVCNSRMRVQKLRGYFAYVCGGRPPGSNLTGRSARMHVAIKAEWIEQFVTGAVLARLATPDAADLFVAKDNNDIAAARAEIVNLRSRLDAAVKEMVSGRLSAATLAQIESAILPQIDEAERRAIPANVSPTLATLIASGADPAAEWADLVLAQRREFITEIATIVVDPVKSRAKPREFDLCRLASSRWRGDTKTWGERWAAGDPT